MADINYVDSQYKFTNPIRYFKANDPIYYEVDNIPLKQLMKNDLWLKDQLSSSGLISNVERSDFVELKPYVNGNDNVVHIKPGRFMGRVNDAYQITPLQRLTRLLGDNIGEIDNFEVLSQNNASIDEIWDRITSYVAADALNMNGLVERSFGHISYNDDTSFSITGSPTYPLGRGITRSPFPGVEVQTGNFDTNATEYVNNVWNDGTLGFASLGTLENNFIKRWRGVARTAIVDVPSELTINVPPFVATEFSYWDENRNQQILTDATQRIDLIFVYTKPIDASAVTVAKYVNNQPTKITAPMLGIVKGAGIILSKQKLDIQSGMETLNGLESDGVSKMFPAIADELDSNNGFTGLNIHGSFPSPDDLMNLAPLLLENLADDDLQLVGQSVLPIAYVKVSKASMVNSAGNPVIQSADLIDIRPFFRTAELAYNERAGIAAAVPSLSLANPAVGKGQLDREINRVVNDYTGKINALGGDDGFPRVVGTGYVKGGVNFGVEGAILQNIQDRVSNTTLTVEALKAVYKTRYGLPDSFVVNDYPDWDIASFLNIAGTGNPNRGTYPNDRIFTVSNRGNQNQIKYGPWSDSGLSTRLTEFGTDNIRGKKSQHYLLFCKKTIRLSKAQVPWMKDFIVNAHFWNCVPLSCRTFGKTQDGAAASTGIWVDKKGLEFTIYVSWVANDYFPLDNAGTERPLNPNTPGQADPYWQRDVGSRYAGFAVINEDIINATNANPVSPGEPPIGVAIYPSVYFEIIGIPNNFSAHGVDLNAETPVITLS